MNGTLLGSASLALANSLWFQSRMLRNPKSFAPGARGAVCWIDQSADHQVRPDPERVRAALKARGA